MMGIIRAAIRHNVFVNILTVLILAAGVMGALSMSREIFPEMSVDMILVTVIFRGADPTEVEEGISQKIEEAIEGLEGVKNFYTYADENVGAGLIECREDYDIAKLKEEVRDRMDAIMDFPSDAEKPIVTEIKARGPVLSLSIFGHRSEAELKETAEEIKRDLLLLPEISQVSVGGVRDYEISIEVSEEKLRQFNLTFAQVASAVRSLSLNMPGGSVKTDREEISVRSIGRRYTAQEFGRLVVLATPDGAQVPLERVAFVRDGFEEEPIVGTFNGRRAALVRIFKTPQEDTISIADAVRRYLQSKTLPKGMEGMVWRDTSKLVASRIDLLVRNGSMGFLLVFLILWLFLDLRLGFWVSLGIPISLGGAMAILYLFDQSLNMLSLFGLIMVLGIVVDDAIVVGEAVYYQRKKGLGPIDAAFEGVREMATPVFAAVSTTIVAFLPLFFVAGIMGRFIRVIPIAVVAALVVSLFECLFLLPAHLNHLPDFSKVSLMERIPILRLAVRFRKGVSLGVEAFAENVYGRLMAFFFRWRYVFQAGSLAALFLAFGLVAGGHIKFTPFPQEDSEFLSARLEFPRGTPLAVTYEAAQRIEEGLQAADREVAAREGKSVVVLTYAISGALSGYENTRGSHLAEVQTEILPAAEREVSNADFLDLWRSKVGSIPGAVSFDVSAFSPGHFGKAMEIWVLGRDLGVMRKASADLRARMAEVKGLYNIEEDYRPGKREVRIALRPQARNLGLTLADVSGQVRSAFYGSEALRMQRGRDNLRVYLRYPLEGRSALERLETMRVTTPSGDKVPLQSVAEFSFEEGYSRIVRQNGLRRLVISAEVVPGVANAADVLADLRKETFPDLTDRYPGIRISVEGQEKEQKAAMQSLMVGFALVMGVIFLILATIFRSYAQPLVILTTIPFGTAGVILGHLLLGFDLTLMSMFGLVALAGVVVNDAIIMIEAVNTRLLKGASFASAVRAGGVRRFRPVVLTTLTTFFGLMPLMTETDFQARMLIPMAISIAFGVGFATFLTLFLLPCQLGMLNDIRRLWFWLFEGRFPTAEEVEPASLRGREDKTDEAAPPPDPLLSKVSQ
jgi:multidrug efflux pump subunit AcrB